MTEEKNLDKGTKVLKEIQADKDKKRKESIILQFPILKNEELLYFKTKCVKCKKEIYSYFPVLYPLYCKDCVSKDPRIEKIAGRREPGLPYQIPFELDFFCPVCGTEPIKQKKFDDSLDFSEYRYFMYCPNCNLDIPTFLCLRANTKEKVEIYTERYLDMIKEIKIPKTRGKRSLESTKVRINLLQLLLYVMLDFPAPVRFIREKSWNKDETKKADSKVISYPFSRLRQNKYLFLLSLFDRKLAEKLNFKHISY